MGNEEPEDAPRSALLVEPLTEREQMILRFVANGLSDREIAQRLSLALDTVKWYNKRIYSKLDVHNRTQAATLASDLGVLHSSVEINAPMVSVGAASVPRHNLPAQLSSFVGRRHDITAVKKAFESSRLLTLTGIGGSGKTRLALQVAREILGDFSDGVYFVPLAPVPMPDRILWALAETLHVQFDVHSEPRGQLLSYLRPKNLLLVLDNFDHLIAGAALIAEILQAAPSMKVMVTSRERLNLYGEVSYSVTGMALPQESNCEDAAQFEAVQLFTERAHSVSAEVNWTTGDLAQIVRICRLVAGMPLGIELAATWMDTLSPKEIADEIECNLDILEAQRQDISHSQRSIRAAFNRSWQLLDEAQQSAFRRLSVFRNGFTREAAETVTGVGLRTLQALVNKSLLWRNPHTGRYEFHELLRHFAEEQLEASSEWELTPQAHAAFFANFMAERWTRMKDHRQRVTVQEVEADIENIRAAWKYCLRVKNAALLNQFLHTLWSVYDIRGWYLAAIELFEQGIQVMRGLTTRDAQMGLGWLLAVQGLCYVSRQEFNRSSSPAPSWMMKYGIYIVSVDARHGLNLAQEGVEILKRLSHAEEMLIIPLISLFITSCQLDEQGVPIKTAQECLEAATRIGDQWSLAKAKQLLAVKAIGDSDYQQAERLAHESLAIFDANGDSWSTSILCTEVLGLLAIRLGQYETAKEWIHRGFKAAREIDFKYAMQMAYWQLGFVATLEENYSEAGLYWGKALGIAEQILGGSRDSE